MVTLVTTSSSSLVSLVTSLVRAGMVDTSQVYNWVRLSRLSRQAGLWLGWNRVKRGRR